MTPPVAANDFVRQWEDLGEDALAAVDRVGRSGWLVLGEEVAGFEAELAAWWGVPHAVGVASGLDAISIGLRCVGIGPGDRVVTTPLTAFATTLAIVQVGARPIWVDVDETGSLDLDLTAQALQADPSIRAVVPVHLYGHPLDPDRLRALEAEFDVVVVEDCAQSAGAERAGAPTGAAGRVAATSLYPTKNLGAMGDGGVVLTADEEVAARARSLRDYGQRARYEHVELGLNSRLDEVQAAIMRSAQLPRLDRHLARRREVATHYTEALRDTSLRPIVATGGTSAHHLYPVEVEEDPDAVFAALREAGIGVGRHYPFVCPDQPAAVGVGDSIGDLSVSRRLAARELSLPIHPYLTDAEVETVIAACLRVGG
ncbi:MAG TPA: DegT/DnrJ/EryC1/StrS family aminotransferase [Solirubrobacterales bacterium]|nr:DegT/DnrJ/EryC1/StrS family aminotransferase [Solirubrobacterales bacterium]